jgi:23S rRNA (cytidine1920-2'-O)/16S rRNA (cytidine1409-2'-O)-methyltransferase
VGAATGTSNKKRVDILLVERGLAPTRARARDAIERGLVTVGGQPVAKAGLAVAADAQILVSGEADPYVSRGGLKLAHALDHFAIDPLGLVALDLGASTGGFTDVLLRRGAVRVIAVDVGHGQLHESLRQDERVTVFEKLNARDLGAKLLPMTPDLIVADMSFISLKVALPAALDLAATGARLVALIKPQFEVGRERVGKGGVVRDPALHVEVCREITAWLDARGWRVLGITPSPIEGPDGNREFLIGAIRDD